MAGKKKITIKGAGISGLTAAISLLKNDFEVELFDTAPISGTRFNGDFQGIENWSSQKDVLDELESFGIKTDFFYKDFTEITLNSKNRKNVKASSKENIFYIVKRGPKNSLDSNLLKQAKELGADINFNKKLQRKPDISASGPKGNIFGYAKGITFKTDFEDIASLILDDSVAPKGYAYLLVVKGEATLAVVTMPEYSSDISSYLKKAINEFKTLENFKIQNENEFAGFGKFKIPKTAEYSGTLYTGEDAGFQDYLAGFGMRYAFRSGYLAAKSIIENKNYDDLWKECFLKNMKISKTNRFLFELIGNKGYDFLVKKAKNSEDIRNLLFKVYSFSLPKKLFFF